MKITIGKGLLFLSLSVMSLNIYAAWECYAADKKGHTWASAGTNEHRASKVALSFCSAYSPNSSSCHVTKCYTK
jgi:hypothetical protein